MARSTYVYIVRTWPHEAWIEPKNVATFTVKREAQHIYPEGKRGGLRLWRYKDGEPDEGIVIDWEDKIKLPNKDRTYKLVMERSSQLNRREDMSLDALRGDNEQAQQILDAMDE